MKLKNKRQVVIINDIKSDKIEQAIFILRDDKTNQIGSSKTTESALVLEANRIINSFLYPEQLMKTYKRPKFRKTAIVQCLLFLSSSAVVVGTTIFLFKLFFK